MAMEIGMQSFCRYLLHRSIDWVLAASLFVIGKVLNEYMPIFQRKFSANDLSISFPMTLRETVPNSLLWTLSLVVPAIIIALLFVVHKNALDSHNGLLGLLYSCGVAYFITHFVKNLVGRPRPDFLARCQFGPTIDHTYPVRGLYNVSLCLQSNAQILNDGFKSFFSGHTSLAFAGLGFLSLYFSGKLCLFHHSYRGNVYKVYLVLLPLVIAAFIGLSRVSDYRHHWQDVFVGMIIGLLSAWFSYSQFFHSLFTNSGSPRYISSIFGLPYFNAANIIAKDNQGLDSVELGAARDSHDNPDGPHVLSPPLSSTLP